MPTNDFIGFASSGSANIMSQADFAAAAEQGIGVQPGPASSKLANKIWRQGANMAAAIGKLLLDQGYNALDNGDIDTLKTSLIAALVTNVEKVSSINLGYIGHIYYKSGLQLCWGLNTGPTVGDPGNTVTYSRAFKQAPIAVVTRRSGASTTGVADLPWIREPNATSMNVYVPVFTGYYWIAVGEGA